MDDQALASSISTGDQGEVSPFRNLPRHEQRRLLVGLVERGRSDEEIGQEVGLSQWQVRNLRYRLGIKKDRGGNVYLEPGDRRANRPSGGTATRPAPSPFSLALRGYYRGDQLARRLDALRALFENGDPDRQYQVNIELMESADSLGMPQETRTG